jgi:hypothetical protein
LHRNGAATGMVERITSQLTEQSAPFVS